ncbi:protein of unknown function [Pseudorhizobium banfieldiae]|uniref:Uncharacterized protein n=1 Tax=Pseudorhizobium banfieldiae TaxID=1125847 RepID=L0NET9_9HYPH|nr:protein of unknown function [Pseudorhizobium banfieldiae]
MRRADQAGADAFLGRRRSLERKRMQRSTHVSLEGVVNHLVLLNAGLAAESFSDDFRRVMVTIARQIPDRDLGSGDPGLDHVFDVSRVHGHDVVLLVISFR